MSANLELHQHATLTMPGVGRIQARVEFVEGSRVVLGLYTIPDEPLAEGPALVEIADRRGIHRYAGTVGEIGPDGDLVHLVLAEDGQLIQRREFVRVPAAVPVTLALGGRTGMRISTFTRDISGNGLNLAGPDVLRVGDQAWVWVSVPDGPQIEGMIATVRESSEGRAVRFVELAEKAQDRLVRFIFERERRSLVTRDG